MTSRNSASWRRPIRSKNAGVDKITFDIIFRDRENYERVRRARVLTRESVAKLYRIPDERISDFVEYDPGCAIKFTIYRLRRAAARATPTSSAPSSTRRCSMSK